MCLNAVAFCDPMNSYLKKYAWDILSNHTFSLLNIGDGLTR